MKKSIKWSLSAITILAATSIVVVPITQSLVAKKDNSINHDVQEYGNIRILDNNGIIRRYETYDDALKDLMSQTDVNYSTFVGKMGRPNANGEIPNIHELKLFDSNKKQIAYNGKNNIKYPSKKEAAQSYLTDIRTYYQDNAGNLYDNKLHAESSNKELKQSEALGVYYYKIYDASLDKEFNINPINQKDIQMFKKIALRNLVSNKSSAFKASYGVTLANINYTNIDYLFNGNKNNGIDIKDVALNTINQIMHILAQEKDKVTYNMNVKIADQGNYALLESTRVRKRVVTHHPSGDNIHWYPADAGPGTKDYKETNILKYNIYKDDSIVDRLVINNLKSEDVKNTATLFRNRDTFLKNSQKFDDRVNISLHAHDNTGKFHYALNNNWKLTIPTTKQVFDIRTNGQSVLPGNPELNKYSFQHKTDRLLSDTNGYNDIHFNFDVTVNDEEIVKSKNETIKALTQTIFDNFIFVSKDIKDSFVKQNKEETFLVAAEQTAKNIFNSFISALHSSNFLGKFDDIHPTIESAADLFYVGNEPSKVQTILNNSKVWWIKYLNNSNAFSNAFSELLRNLAPVKNQTADNFIYITYNNIPVFKVARPENENLLTLRDELVLIQKDILDNESDAKWKEIINISSDILPSTNSKGFMIDSSVPKQINWTFDEKEWTKLGNFTIDKTHNVAELNKRQHLLVSPLDKPESLRNDAGIEAALNLYNIHAAKIAKVRNESAEAYVNRIEEDSYGTNEVLRLFEPNITDQTSYKASPLRVYYGEIKTKTGTFNPSLYSRVVYSYLYEKEAATNGSTIPLEVPVVHLADKVFPLANIANNVFDKNYIVISSSGSTHSLEMLLLNATAVLMEYIQPDELHFLYEGNVYDNTDINSVYCYDVGNTYFSKYFKKEKYYFVDPIQAQKHLKAVLAKNELKDI